MNRKILSLLTCMIVTSAAWAAMQATNAGLTLPFQTGAVGASSMLLDATAEKATVVFQVPATGNISNIIFRTGTVTTSDTIYAILVTVDSSGNPTTTLYGGVSTGTVSGLVSNTTYTITFAASASATRGDIVALVIGYNSYVAGNLNISYEAPSNGPGSGLGFPYINHFTSSWSKISGYPVVALGYDDGTFKNIGNSMITGTTVSHTYNSGSATDEYALKFQVPFPTTIEGVALPFNSANDHPLWLYSSDGSTVLTVSTIPASTAQYAGSPKWMYVRFPSSISISASTNYYLSLKPTASNVVIYRYTAPSVAAMSGLPGGANWILSSRVNDGSWTDTTTAQPLIYPIFGSFDDAVSSGGTKTTIILE